MEWGEKCQNHQTVRAERWGQSQGVILGLGSWLDGDVAP